MVIIFYFKSVYKKSQRFSVKYPRGYLLASATLDYNPRLSLQCTAVSAQLVALSMTNVLSIPISF